MTIWYRANTIYSHTEIVEAARETNKCIYIKTGMGRERRRLKTSSRESYFKTESEAMEFIAHHQSKNAEKNKEIKIKQSAVAVSVALADAGYDALACIERLPEIVERLEKLTEAINDLIGNSFGVDGLHMNGDIAEWDEITVGGRSEGWLLPLDDAERTLSTLKGEGGGE